MVLDRACADEQPGADLRVGQPETVDQPVEGRPDAFDITFDGRLSAELEGSEVRGRGRRPGALALLHDLMVCGTGESASLGLHGSGVAVRNRRPAL
jgi:hypothetical protein